MSKPFSFRDLMVVDQTEGSWDDAIGLIAYQYKKRRRGLIGEAVEDKCKECDCEPCVCDESLEAQFDALTPTDEAALTGRQRFDMDRVNAGAMSQDEYNKKYKLGKYRPAGNKLTGPGGLYKNLVKKEDADLDESWSDGFVDKFTRTVYNPKENILTLTWRNYEQWPKKYKISSKDGEKLLGNSLQNRSRFLNQLIKDGRLKEIQ